MTLGSGNGERDIIRNRYLLENVAVTVFVAFIVTEQVVAVPVHAPPQPWKTLFLFGVAVSITTVPGA